MVQLSTLIYVQNQEQKKTLMMLRNKKPNDIHEGKRNWLWGKIEMGESPDACCLRELQEESWLIGKNIELKWILTAPQFSHNTDRYIFIYIVTKRDWELQECNEGELHRIDDEKILNLNLREGDRRFIPLLSKPWVFRTTLRYKDGKLEKWELQ